MVGTLASRRSRAALRGRPAVLGPAAARARLRARQRRLGAAAARQPARPARVPARARRTTTATREVVCDPGNPQRAPGAFGEKSVLSAPGYRPPAWLEEPGRAGDRRAASSVRVLGRPLEIGVWSPGDGELPLLVAHDGPEYDALAGLTRYAGGDDRARRAAAVPGRAAAARRPQRVVLGLGRLRPRAVLADPARAARRGRRSPAGRSGWARASAAWRCSTRSAPGRARSPGCSCSRAASSCPAMTATSRGFRAIGGSCGSSAACCARGPARAGPGR